MYRALALAFLLLVATPAGAFESADELFDSLRDRILRRQTFLDPEAKALEIKLLKEGSHQALSALELLYTASPNLRYQRLYRHGGLQDTPDMADTLMEGHAFYAALFAQEKANQIPEFRITQTQFPEVGFSSSLLENERRMLVRLATSDDVEPPPAVLRKLFLILTYSSSFGFDLTPHKGKGGYRLYQFATAYFLASRPKMSAAVLTQLGEAGPKWVSSLLLECASVSPASEVEALAIPFCRKSLAGRLGGDFKNLSLQEIVNPWLAAADSAVPDKMEEALPTLPNLDKTAFAKLAARANLFALPSPDGVLKGGAATLPIDPMRLKSLKTIDGIPSTRHTVATPVSDPSTILSMEQSDGTPLTLCFEGSDDKQGCYYKKTTRMVDSPELGFSGNFSVFDFGVDAYMREGQNSSDLKFWVGVTSNPAPSVHWVVVRATVVNKWLTAPRGILINREDIRNAEERVWAKPEYQEYYKKKFKDQPSGEIFKDVFTLSDPAFKTHVDAAIKDSYENSRIEPASDFAPLQCTVGCLYKDPVAVEPESRWAIFAVSPERKSPLLIETKVKPGVNIPKEDIRNGRSFFQTFLVEFFEVDPPSHRKSRWDAYLSGPSKISPPMPASYIMADASQAGLLFYVESLSRHLMPGGWFHPNPGEPVSVFAAATALMRLDLVASFEKVGTPAELPEPETYRIPWKQRLSFVKKSLPTLGHYVSSTYLKEVEKKPRLLLQEIEVLDLLISEIESGLKAGSALDEPLLRAMEEESATILGGKVSATAGLEDVKRNLGKANELLGLRLADLKFELRIACELLPKLQLLGGKHLGSYVPDPTVLGECAERAGK